MGAEMSSGVRKDLTRRAALKAALVDFIRHWEQAAGPAHVIDAARKLLADK